MGRPRKWGSEQERRAANRISERDQQRRKRAEIRAMRQREGTLRYKRLDPVDEAPPSYVMMERDLRRELLHRRGPLATIMDDPPREYASAYPDTAWRHQAAFANNSSV